MTRTARFACFALSVAFFAPVAFATFAQAAQIVS